VHIWGEGPWRKYLKGKNYSIQPAIPFAESLSVMQQSRVVLNSSPRFTQGGHERIFYALMCGASVYTGQNAYLSATLPTLYTYRYGEWEPPPHFDGWQERAEEGQRCVLAEHTWERRAKTLVAYADSQLTLSLSG
jgi:hypothetical protein